MLRRGRKGQLFGSIHDFLNAILRGLEALSPDELKGFQQSFRGEMVEGREAKIDLALSLDPKNSVRVDGELWWVN
jgi:hypothetical protein